jgi:TrmH family RNA methyltransferase
MPERKMITSPHNEKLKRIRRLHKRRERERSGLFVAEGEDLVEAAVAAGVEPEVLLVADADVEAALLDSVSTLGSGTRVIGVYRQRWAPAPVARASPGSPEITASLSVYLHGVGDPGNVGTIIRTAHALCDGPVVLGPECADPYSPKAVRASMGSVFARPPARAELGELVGTKLALDAGADASMAELDLEPPVVVCVGAERAGLAKEVRSAADLAAKIPMRSDGPNSINAAVAAAVAIHELANRMAGHA